MEQLQKKYGFFTAVAMVVGIVIGSGVFKSAGDVLNAAGGDLNLAIIAWLVGGIIMIISAYSFSIVAVRIEKNSGIVDYVEAAAGEKAGYFIAWFLNFIYYPILIGILGWLAGTITVTLFNLEFWNDEWIIGLLFISGTFGLNFVSPLLSGKWQISATVIKLIPLFLIAIVGLVYGFINGQIIDNFKVSASNATEGTLAKAVAFTVFAYDGWIISTSINGELKNAKKNLPRALVLGSLLVVFSYLLYFIGLSGVLSNNTVVSLSGSLNTSVEAAKVLFGTLVGNSIVVLVLVSVLGTLNGVTMAGIRGMYSISIREKGPAQTFFLRRSKNDSTINSGLISVFMTLFWLLIWYGNFQGYWGGKFMDTSILTIVFLYSFYIVVYIYIMRKIDDISMFSRYIVPGLSILGALYLVYGAFTSDGLMFLFFALLVLLISLIGWITYNGKSA